MKQKIYIRILAAAMVIFAAAVSCNGSDDETASARHERIEFKTTGDPSVADYPQARIVLNFEVSYSAGIRSIVAMLDGEEIEDSLTEYDDEPQTAAYTFRYTLLPSQAGQTIDFVFEATGADGYKGSCDYPVYVYAKQAEISIRLPEDIASECYVEDELAFTVEVESSLIDLMRIRTLKNTDVLEYLTKTEGFTTPRSDKYEFSYIPQPTDKGQSVRFIFEVTDAEGNLVSESCEVSFVSKPIEGVKEFYGVNLGYQRNNTYGQFLDLSEGVVYPTSEGYEHCADIDLAIFWSGNSTTIGMAVCGPNTSNASTIFNQDTINAIGGDSNDVITNWPVRNATQFVKTTLTEEDFAAIDSAEALRATCEAVMAGVSSGLANMLTPGCIVAFETVDGECGLIKVVDNGGTNNTNSAVIDYLIEDNEQ